MSEGGKRVSYLELLRTPGVARLEAAAALAGIGTLARPVSLLLYAREQTNSFASAGLILAGLTAGSLLSGPLRGRQLDRLGYSRSLLALGVLSSVWTASVVAAGELGLPAVVLAGLGGLAGATSPPVGAALRSLWRGLLGESAKLKAAYATTTMLNEITFFAGPLLAGAVIALFSPAAALIAAAAMVFAGTVAFALTPAARAEGAGGEPERGRPPLRARGVRTMLATALAFGAVFGTLEVALPAFAVERDSPGAGGLLLAALSPGIVIGGYLYGRRPERRGPGELYARLCGLATLGLVPLAFAGSIPLLAGLTVLAGMAFAPVTTCQWALIDVVAPAGTAVETTSWLTSLYLTGSVAGTAVGGAVAQHGSTDAAFGVAVGGAAFAWLVAALRSGTLRPSAAPQPSTSANA